MNGIDLRTGTKASLFDRLAGIIVYNVKGEPKPTSSDAVRRGCSVFKDEKPAHGSAARIRSAMARTPDCLAVITTDKV